nr:hypothetical protein [Candidatus Gracilibacteria bacterium]
MKKLILMLLALGGFFFLTSAQAEESICTMDYNPVCGEKEVQCIKAPCPALKTTYGNKCTMEAAQAKFLYEGECKEECPKFVRPSTKWYQDCKKKGGKVVQNKTKNCLLAPVCKINNSESSCAKLKTSTTDLVKLKAKCEQQKGELAIPQDEKKCPLAPVCKKTKCDETGSCENSLNKKECPNYLVSPAALEKLKAKCAEQKGELVYPKDKNNCAKAPVCKTLGSSSSSSSSSSVSCPNYSVPVQMRKDCEKKGGT